MTDIEEITEGIEAEEYELEEAYEEGEAEEGVEAEVAEEGEGEEVVTGSITDVQGDVFQEVRLPEELIRETQEAWNQFLNAASSREAAGEALYGAIFDAAPSLQNLFKTPRAVMVLRLVMGLNGIINDIGNPSSLKVGVETLGFQHMEFDVTVPRVVIFRDAIVELIEIELGARFTSKAKIGLRSVLNYVGGAFIFVRKEYSGRLKIIASSWRTANQKAQDEFEAAAAAEEAAEEGEGGEEAEAKNAEKQAAHGNAGDNNNNGEKNENNANAKASGEISKGATKIPTTFNEMFVFNGAVMGFGNSSWMSEVLLAFDDIVNNVANSTRLQEECDTVSLCLAKYSGQINLPEFKAVMLASLRSLVPKDWNGDHEVAWTWLWENVERMLKSLMGKPAVMEKALERFILSFTEDSQNYLRREIYARFFALAPAGQDYFKQSTTRLYWVADRVTELTMEMYRDPKKIREDISGVGLRHVGYDIPTEFFAPYVTGAVEVIRSMNADETAEEAFRFSLSLIGRMMVRTVNEGSTIVMKAINVNSASQLRKAVSCAPRGKRATWVLNITVGTQSISPFFWAIESGSLEVAKAMIEDLLIIRADRDNYYYGCDAIFERHPDTIQKLCLDAMSLLPPLFDGLIWRSRVATNGRRRVNYYVKHLIQDKDRKFNQALEWLVEAKDPKLICHPLVVLFSDMIWSSLANRFFLVGRLYLLLTLLVFMTSQSILQRMDRGYETKEKRIAVAVLRVFIYFGSLGQLLYSQICNLCKDVRNKRFSYVFKQFPVPAYLLKWKESLSLLLITCLLIMLANEPIFYCLPTNDYSERRLQATGTTTATTTKKPFTNGLLNQNCALAQDRQALYSDISMLAMIVYWVLLTDLSVFSTHISAWVLVCGKILSEVFLFLGALLFLIITFSSSINALRHKNKDFDGVHTASLTLLELALGMYPSNNFEAAKDEPVILVVLCVFVTISLIFLLNLLIAQLNGAYQKVYIDMVGYARLNRGRIITETMVSIPEKSWLRFLDSLKLDDPLEFNEGDIGLAGGVQVTEPSNANPTTIDAIRRFGGSTSPASQWPLEDNNNEDDDKFERLEKAILKASKAGEKKSKKRSGAGAGSSQGISGHSGSESGGGGSENEA
eukprot:TRINITY_DN1346_c0_g1_i1.p1 TRINITY_DN1346_c0_g1~~TRINITY_DN1346_c0_g1_i1.p1  ORF type:complete len:1126 (+),score=265.45 TRINITY_DN1346_c0_g1_i1:107-3484(+)